MFYYIAKRIFLFLPTVFFVSCIVFLLSKQIPYDSVETVLALQGIDEADVQYEKNYALEKKRQKLDLPTFYFTVSPTYFNLEKTKETNSKIHYPSFHFHGLNNQYHHWFGSFLAGNFGTSLLDNRPIETKIWEALRWTLTLMFLSLFLAILFSFPLGIFLGMNAGKKWDRWISMVSYAAYSIPVFWLATMMIIFLTTSEYGTWTNIFPSVGIWHNTGSESFGQMLLGSLNKLLLPLIVILIPDVAYLSRLIRSSIREEKNKAYIKVAVSKGISQNQLIKKHILPNSMIPIITLFAGVIPSAIASSLVIEVIFNIPGVGRLMYSSIRAGDWATVYPIILLISILAILMYLLSDILIAYLNPKIKLEH